MQCYAGWVRYYILLLLVVSDPGPDDPQHDNHTFLYNLLCFALSLEGGLAQSEELGDKDDSRRATSECLLSFAQTMRA